MALIIENIATIRAKMTAVCERVGRSIDDVMLMPVTKTVAAERIREAISGGYCVIGENKVQEIQAKMTVLADLPHEVHLIGHLQTNKVKDVVGKVSCIQSLDSIKLARKLQERLAFEDKTIRALVQVNTSNEESKTGVKPEEALDLIREVLAMDRIKLEGLMTIGANTDDKAEIRRCFRQLVTIQRTAQDTFAMPFSVLSMGMSGDMEIAIEEGSTMIRVGSAIFGARDYSK